MGEFEDEAKDMMRQGAAVAIAIAIVITICLAGLLVLVKYLFW